MTPALLGGVGSVVDADIASAAYSLRSALPAGLSRHCSTARWGAFPPRPRAQTRMRVSKLAVCIYTERAPSTVLQGAVTVQGNFAV